MDKVPLDSLPFSLARQDAVLGHLILNEKFFKQCRTIVKAKWFNDGYAVKVYQALLNYAEKHSTHPTYQELQATKDFENESQGVRNRMIIKVAEAINATQIYRLDSLKPELTDWLHARYFHEGVHEAQQLFNASQMKEAYAKMAEKMHLIRTTTFDDSSEFEFSNFVSFVNEQEVATQEALTFGQPILDRLLLPEAEGRGSLLPGDTTILLAPTNVGKTTTMITVAAANIRKGKSVLFITHEGREEDIAIKFWCNLIQRTKAEIFEAVRGSPDGEAIRKSMADIAKILPRHLTYVPMNKAGLTVEEVERKIRKLQEERIAQFGKGYDLVVNDYPAKLGSEQMKYGQFQKRNLDEYVYNIFIQLGLEYKFHVLCAIQTNRTGSKINRGQKGYEDRLLTHEDVMESFGPMTGATTVITINRDHHSEGLGYITYFISKSRSSHTGTAVVCKSDFIRATTHHERLGAMWYRGNTPLGEQVGIQFAQFQGREISNGMPPAPGQAS